MALLVGLLTRDLFNTVIEKRHRSPHDYYGMRQRNRDLQASGIPRVSVNPEDASIVDARAGSSKLGFGFPALRGKKETEGERHMI